jgi:hypothetical protein
LRVQDARTLTPHAKKGNPKAAPTHLHPRRRYNSRPCSTNAALNNCDEYFRDFQTEQATTSDHPPPSGEVTHA